MPIFFLFFHISDKVQYLIAVFLKKAPLDFNVPGWVPIGNTPARRTSSLICLSGWFLPRPATVNKKSAAFGA